MKDYYEILEIEPKATIEQIKKAFRIKAVKFHPDKNFGDPLFVQKFIEIKEAYDILSNSITKQEYDLKYQQIFGQQKTTNQKQEQHKEEKTKQKQEEEKFRYDPHKAFYSIFDREVQETPQYPPIQTPWGNPIQSPYGRPIDGTMDFFVLPQKIGKIIGGYSTLFKGAKAISPFQLFIKVVKSSVFGISITAIISFLLYCNWTYNLHHEDTLSSALIFFFVIIGIILVFKLLVNSNSIKFEHCCWYIGINGFAFFKCSSSRENIIEKTEVNFNDVTDLFYSVTVHKVNFQTRRTTYEAVWLNSKTKKVVYTTSGDAFIHIYWTMLLQAEKYWTLFLLDNMEKRIEEKRYIEFNLYPFNPFIRIGIGYITFLKGADVFTYKFNDIKRIYSKDADLFIEHKNFEKKLLFFKSGNQDSIPLRQLCNRQFFYKAMEILLGYKIN